MIIYGQVLSDESAGKSGFIGYVKESNIREKMIMHVVAPEVGRMSTFEFMPPVLKDYQENATYSREVLPGYRVYGSHITGDSDLAQMTFPLGRENEILYITGPIAHNQRIRIFRQGQVRHEAVLQRSTSWRNLDLDASFFDGLHTLQIIDNGAKWGEWSGIAVREETPAILEQ